MCYLSMWKQFVTCVWTRICLQKKTGSLKRVKKNIIAFQKTFTSAFSFQMLSWPYLWSKPTVLTFVVHWYADLYVYPGCFIFRLNYSGKKTIKVCEDGVICTCSRVCFCIGGVLVTFLLLRLGIAQVQVILTFNLLLCQSSSYCHRIRHDMH